MAFGARRRALVRQARKLLARDDFFRRILLGLSALGTAIATASGYFLDSEFAQAAITVGLASALLSMLGTFFLGCVDSGAPRALSLAFQAEDRVRQVEELLTRTASDFGRLALLFTVGKAFDDVVEQVVRDGPGTAAERLTRTQNLLDLVVGEMPLLIGVANDYWTFSVYLYDPDVGELVPTVVRRPTMQDQYAPHRNWKPAEGHIGQAFARKQEMVASDTNIPEVRNFFEAPAEKRKDEDASVYRSIASIPIMMEKSEPIGVVAATSDAQGRFRPDPGNGYDNVEPLRLLSKAIAVVNGVSHLHRQ